MNNDKLYIRFFDVGLGDCIFASSKNQYLLIDGGSYFSDELKLFLEKHRIDYIDYVVCTHAHEDHVDGLADILGSVKFGTIYSNIKEFPKSVGFSKIKRIVEERNKSFVVPEIGESFSFGDSFVTFLSPGKHSELVSGNDRSLTCMIECFGKKILMAADVGRKVFDLWDGINVSIKADVFKIPHHGLEYINKRYIEKIAPDYSVVSYGKNDYNILNKQLMEELSYSCKSVFNTYEGGSIECYISEDSEIKMKYFNESVKDKKLLILAANEETKKFVMKAHELGVKVIVTDHIMNSPAKKTSDEFWDVNGKNVEEIVRSANETGIDGVLVGVADPLVESYLEISTKLNLPCYLAKENIGFFTDKNIFKTICKEHGLNVVEMYYYGKDFQESISKIKKYPCIIKPARGRGGRGVSLCRSKKEVKEKFDLAKNYSDDDQVIVERYMECGDIIANYLFVDGRAYLIAVSDRKTLKSAGSISPVTYANVYPSTVTDLFVEKCDEKFRSIFADLHIINGILEVQTFWDGQDFYPYDPACILGGELSSPVFSEVIGVDLIGCFIKYALTGKMSCKNTIFDYGKMASNTFAQSVWILLKVGTIDKICGIDEAKKMEGVLGCVQRLAEGEVVTPGMFETEKSALARFWIVADSRQKLEEREKKVRAGIKVFDTSGNEMVWMDYAPLKG